MNRRELEEKMQEYLARGGKITVYPAVKPDEQTHILPVKVQLDHDTMSLGDGEFFFGEVRKRESKKKKVSSEEFTEMVKSSNLPQAVMDALLRVGAKK